MFVYIMTVEIKRDHTTQIALFRGRHLCRALTSVFFSVERLWGWGLGTKWNTWGWGNKRRKDNFWERKIDGLPIRVHGRDFLKFWMPFWYVSRNSSKRIMYLVPFKSDNGKVLYRNVAFWQRGPVAKKQQNWKVNLTASNGIMVITKNNSYVSQTLLSRKAWYCYNYCRFFERCFLATRAWGCVNGLI